MKPIPVLRQPDEYSVIAIENLVKSYGMAGGAVTALKGISFSVRRGEYASIMGQSGSGKSTLLHVLGCLHRSTSGSYKLDGVEVLSGLKEGEQVFDQTIAISGGPRS